MEILLLKLPKHNVNNSMKNKIKELRIELNITQEELAKRVGVRRETIVFLEQDKYNPSLQLAHNVAKTLKTTIDKLFIFENKKDD